MFERKASARAVTKPFPTKNLRFYLTAPSRCPYLPGRRERKVFTSLEGLKAYVAGPPAMVEALQHRLASRGLPARDLHADAFYSQAEDEFRLT